MSRHIDSRVQANSAPEKNFWFRLLLGIVGAAGTGLLAYLGLLGIAFILFLATVLALSYLLIASRHLTLREAIYLWGGVVVLTGVYALVMAFPPRVESRLLDSQLTPMPNQAFQLEDANGVSHLGKTDSQGAFVVQAVPVGRFIISADGQQMAANAIPAWVDKLTRFNRVNAGDIILHPASPTATPLAPTLTTPPTAATLPPTFAATATPTPTQTPAPIWKVNLQDGQSVPITNTLLIEYTGQFEGDLWVFVVNKDSMHYYPQSPNACLGENMFRQGSQWEMRVGFGGTELSNVSRRYDVVLAVADTLRDSQLIAGSLVHWCGMNNYIGFEQMPDEMHEVYRVHDLVRNEKIFGAAPTLANARVGGSVKITAPLNGSQVPGAAFTVTGTSSDSEGDVWVFVYPAFGIWFPQSNSACEGIITTQAADGTWQVNALFGNDTSRTFEVVAALVNPEASATMKKDMEVWCRAGNFFGYRTIQVPPGVEEKDRVRVTR